jgi:hypothetical protein
LVGYFYTQSARAHALPFLPTTGSASCAFRQVLILYTLSVQPIALIEVSNPILASIPL